MPKIKVKNIPFRTQERVCEGNFCDSKCPFYAMSASPVIVNNYLEHVACLRDIRYNTEETIVELPEKDFPTNREWLEFLSDEDLASFYTLGIPLKDGSYINLYRVAMGYTSSQQGIKEWLSKPCKYLMEDAENDDKRSAQAT